VAVGGAAGLLLGSLALLARPGAGGAGARTEPTAEAVAAATEPVDPATVPEQQRETAGQGA
ncbi:hypothetical protein DN069_13200, partial [Streptacidiphilus pinicola]